MSIIFDYRDHLFLKKKTQLSEYKSFDIFKETLSDLKYAVFKDELSLFHYLKSLEKLILKFAMKCKKKGKKRYLEIIEGILLLLDSDATAV